MWVEEGEESSLRRLRREWGGCDVEVRSLVRLEKAPATPSPLLCVDREESEKGGVGGGGGGGGLGRMVTLHAFEEAPRVSAA